MVLLITGKCMCRCFYCPLSFAKRGKDVIFANELKVKVLDEIIDEAKAISAKGTGITGGDPMRVPGLTIKAIKLLKNKFGFEHHIHLYTIGKFDPKYITKLANAGLDEVRFHPPVSTWTKLSGEFIKLVKLALKTDMLVGFEIPVIPGYKNSIIKFAHYLDSIGAKFLNLNELEFSESNWGKLNSRGYKQKDELANTVKGSEKLAYEILNELARDTKLTISLHYCSAQFKDRQQLTNRIKRRAKNVKEPHQLITDDGTFLVGIIQPTYDKDKMSLLDVKKVLTKNFKVPQKLMKLNEKLNRLEVAPWVLQEIKNELDDNIKSRSFIIEEYPTADRLEVERIPIMEFN